MSEELLELRLGAAEVRSEVRDPERVLVPIAGDHVHALRCEYVFVGAEEAETGDPMVNLAARARTYRFPRYDKNEALVQLEQAYRDAGDSASARAYRDALRPGKVPTWTFCAMVAASLRTGKDADGPPIEAAWAAEYERLGTRVSDADTLLSEMFPLPKAGLGAWPSEYAATFGYRSARRYFSSLWPAMDPECARATILGAAAARAGSARFIVQYGRGSGGEFWTRFEDLLELVPSTGVAPGNERNIWHSVSSDRIEVALTRTGARVVRTGFPWGQGPGRVTDKDVPAIVNALNALRP